MEEALTLMKLHKEMEKLTKEERRIREIAEAEKNLLIARAKHEPEKRRMMEIIQLDLKMYEDCVAVVKKQAEVAERLDNLMKHMSGEEGSARSDGGTDSGPRIRSMTFEEFREMMESE